MRDADNENFPLTFSKLGLAAALIFNRLRVEAQLLNVATQEKDEPAEGNGGRTNENNDRADREYIEQRLKDWAAFERKAKG